nr:MAG TPA: hypothetical protein [Caudoviricetes sp.]
MRKPRPHALTGSLTACGRLSCTQMWARRGRIGVIDPRSGLCFHAQMAGAIIGQTAPRRERPGHLRWPHMRKLRRPCN